jgi:hypothetical protein
LVLGLTLLALAVGGLDLGNLDGFFLDGNGFFDGHGYYDGHSFFDGSDGYYDGHA